MKCLRFLCFLFGFFLVSFFTSLSISNNTFAIDYTFNIVNGTSTLLCSPNNSSTPSAGTPFCDDVYSITFSTDSPFSGQIRPFFGTDSSSAQNCTFQGSQVMYLPFNFNSSITVGGLGHVCGASFGSSFSLAGNTSTWTVVVSTEPPGSEPDCPVCEECQECPAIPENPYDDKFDKIIVAIYTCGAILLVIYFFYCIYRMIIKSTGSNQ